MEKTLTNKKGHPRDRIKALRELFLTMLWMGHRQMAQRLQTYNLTHPQFITLASLVAHGQPVSMRELTEVTFHDAPTMTRIVDRLVKMGLVSRSRRKEDRRVVWVDATSTGQTLIEAIKRDFDREDALGFSLMSAEDLTKMEELLDHILAAYLKYKGEKSGADIEYVKQKLRGFANDPIGFLKSHKIKG